MRKIVSFQIVQGYNYEYLVALGLLTTSCAL